MKPRLILSIKTKFAITAAAIVALISLVWGSWTWQSERQHCLRKVEAQGRLLLTSIRPSIINTILYEEMGLLEDAGLLENIIEDIWENGELQIIYAYIVDPAGKVIVHNNYAETGKIYADSLTRAALSSDGFLSSVADGSQGREPMMDMALPLRISGKTWGALRIGVSMEPVARELAEIRTHVLIFSALFFFIGTAVFYVVGLTMSRPLENLAQAMSGVDSETLEVTLQERREDEIGILQRNFCEMLARLRNSERERRVAVTSLVQSEKMATIGKLVAGVAHEINNPLAAISSCIYALEQEQTELSRTPTDMLKEGLSRIETIVRQLSDFSRAGVLELQHIESDLFFQEAATFARMAVKKSGHSLQGVDMCEPPVQLLIDKAKLHQVLLNLILNAVDASPPQEPIRFTAHLCGTDYCVRVSDQGHGIPAEQQERIFEIFYTTKPAGKGSGMGLAICRHIVEMHHGTISCESEPGKTIFTVRIPVSAG